MAQQRYAPHETYMKNVVRGNDRYVPRRSFPWWAVFLIAACGFGLVKLFISML